MVTIKKAGLKIELEKNEFTSAQDSYEGMFFKLRDGTEIRFILPVTPQIKAITNILMKTTAKNITIDFDAKNMLELNG